MRTLRGFLYLILGGTLCGWMFNRIAAWFIDNPLTVGSNHTVAEWAVILQDPFYLDSRTMPFFFLAFGAIALVAMTKYDWTGEREEQKKLRGEEYGNQRWARDDEMQQFAHTSTVKRVPIRIPQRTRDALRFARNNPKDFIKAKLGMANKVSNPKPDYVEKIEDDNIILSERAELQMSKIPDPALERNKHVYVLGGSGSGKTFNFVGPNLLQLNSSIVTTDPKGDTLKQYGNFFLRHGYKLKVVNTKPDQINQSMHYNPLLYLQDSTSIMQIVNLLVENTSGNAEAEKEDFFVKAERQLYMALMGYLFYFYADQPQYRRVGVGTAQHHGADGIIQPGLLRQGKAVRDAFIVWQHAQQPGHQRTVGTVAAACGGKAAMQQDLGGFWGFAQQVARCKPNAHRASRVAAGRACHHGAQHIK